MLVLFAGSLGARQTQRFVEEMLHAGHWSWHLDTGAMEWSRGFMDLLGIESGSVESTYSEFKRAIHPDDESAQNDLEQMLRDSISIEREFRIVNSSGRVRWVVMRGEPIAGPSGSPNRAVGICYDVTKHREEVQLLRRGEDRLRAISKLTKVLIWATRPDGTLTELLNWPENWQAKKNENYKTSWNSLVHADDLPEFQEKWKASTQALIPFSMEHRLLEPGGSFCKYWSRALPTLSPTGDVREWIGMSQNLQNTAALFPKRDKGITGSQIRAGRAIIGWSVEELATNSGITRGAIRGLEAVDHSLPRHETELAAIEKALFDGGVEFISMPDGKPGVRPR